MERVASRERQGTATHQGEAHAAHGMGYATRRPGAARACAARSAESCAGLEKRLAEATAYAERSDQCAGRLQELLDASEARAAAGCHWGKYRYCV